MTTDSTQPRDPGSRDASLRDPAEVLTRTPPPYGFRVEYGDEPSQFADVRLPADEGTRSPLAILLHGGYWRSRYDLSYLGHLAQALADDGIATYNLEYRRSGEPGGGFPGTFDDIRAGMMLALSLAARHPIDPVRTVIVGHSAGGHLALWMGIRHAIRVPVVALAPVSNLYEAARLGLSNSAVTEFLDGTPESHPERYAFACPSQQSVASATQWVVHGTADEDVPVELATRHADLARETGQTVHLELLEGVGHYELIDPISSAWPAVRHAIRTALGLPDLESDPDLSGTVPGSGKR